MRQPDIDICPDCGEHAEFDENGSECCGAGPYQADYDDYNDRRGSSFGSIQGFIDLFKGRMGYG